MKSLNESLNEYKKIKLNSKSMQSYEKYLHRLRTFELFKWFAKPAEFSPIECAKHGWINLNKDTLKCVVCSSLFYFYSQSPLKSVLSEENHRKMGHSTGPDPKLLVEKHSVHCPWRTLTVSDHLIEVDVTDEDNCLRNFIYTKNTYKNCSKLPLIDDEIYEAFKSDEKQITNESVKQKNFENKKIDKNRRLAILASCGWSYKEDKEILQCEKCIRSIGLWMYKRDLSSIVDIAEIESSVDSENEEINLLSSVNPYSDEIIIKNVLNRIINLIEIEQQMSLKNDYSIERHLSRIANKDSGIFGENNKKRKLDEMDSGDECLASIGEREKRKKVFNPISEHFSWCPWLKEEEHDTSKVYPDMSSSQSNDKQTENTHRQSTINRKSKYFLCYKFINKYLSRDKMTHQNTSNNECSYKTVDNEKLGTGEKFLDNQDLVEKIRSIQSILTKCTSQYPIE